MELIRHLAVRQKEIVVDENGQTYHPITIMLVAMSIIAIIKAIGSMLNK